MACNQECPKCGRPIVDCDETVCWHCLCGVIEPSSSELYDYEREGKEN